MNQEILKQPILISNETEDAGAASSLKSYLPAALAVFGSIAFVLLRIFTDGVSFISDGGLMMLALGSYLLAACFYLTNLYAPSFELAIPVGFYVRARGRDLS
jgi:hypothetical protein